jgi:hypothetical protein
MQLQGISEMSTKLSGVLAVGLLTCGLPASAAVIDFTGGTVTGLDATTVVTDNNVLAWNVDYYEVGNDVAHAHWATGDYGGVESIEISKIGGGSFDLNYFILTSTTDTGGAPASGLEEAWVEGFLQGVSTGAAVQLPSED